MHEVVRVICLVIKWMRKKEENDVKETQHETWRLFLSVVDSLNLFE